MAVMIWLGLYPRPFFEVSRAPMQALQALYAPAGAPRRERNPSRTSGRHDSATSCWRCRRS